ncbi:hypothetical protein AMS68_001474 [Peltaster fructicola]|uniref:C2H2-type domain-containing protein n=1 Tax=Peltaster fructicola TaxID=286661 RepID=A0A6H0XMI1_9PEZI|nr:hypothetical protein AMS68_001474 [Peltaster fructicola]
MNEIPAVEADWGMEGLFGDFGDFDNGVGDDVSIGDWLLAGDEGQSGAPRWVQDAQQEAGWLMVAAEDNGRPEGLGMQENLVPAVEDQGRYNVDGFLGLDDIFTFGGRETEPSLVAFSPQLSSGNPAAPSVTVNGQRSLLVLPLRGLAFDQPAAVERYINPALLELNNAPGAEVQRYIDPALLELYSAPGASSVDDALEESTFVVPALEHANAPGASSVDDTPEESSSAVPAKRGRGRPKLADHEKKKPTQYWCRFGCEKKGPHTSSEGLIVHMCIEHQLFPPGRGNFACEGCGKLFNRQRDLKSHLRGDNKQWLHEHDRTLPKFNHPAPTTREELADTFAMKEHGPVSNRLIVGRENLPGRAEDLCKPLKGKGKGKKRTASEREEMEASADALGTASSNSQTTSLFAASSAATTSASSSAASSFVASASSALTGTTTTMDFGESLAASTFLPPTHSAATGLSTNVDFGEYSGMAYSLLDYIAHH